MRKFCIFGCASLLLAYISVAYVSSRLTTSIFAEMAAPQVIKLDFQTIELALETYRRTVASLPITEQGLEALVKKPTKDPIPDRWHAYLQEVPQDPWRRPYRYRHPGTRSGKGYDLYSIGKDGLDGTADDIGNW